MILLFITKINKSKRSYNQPGVRPGMRHVVSESTLAQSQQQKLHPCNVIH